MKKKMTLNCLKKQMIISKTLPAHSIQILANKKKYSVIIKYYLVNLITNLSKKEKCQMKMINEFSSRILI